MTGEIAIPAVTAAWQNRTTVTATADLAAGRQILRFLNDSTTAEHNRNRFVWIALAPEDIDTDADPGGVAAFQPVFAILQPAPATIAARSDRQSGKNAVAGPHAPVRASGCKPLIPTLLFPIISGAVKRVEAVPAVTRGGSFR